MKTFNDGPVDQYPTFTICFKGDKLHWYHDDQIFNSYGLNATQYEIILKGETALMDKLNTTSNLYNKKPVVINDDMNADLEKFHLKVGDFLHGLRFVTETETTDAYFPIENHGNVTFDAPIHLSYQTADRICFTRNSDDLEMSTRLHDLITFDSSIIGHPKYESTELEVFIHHPGQLIRSFDKPKYKSSLAHFVSTLNRTKDKGPKVLEFKISEIKTLRKRPDSNNACNDDIIDHVKYYQEELSKVIGCIPPYWVNKVSNENELGYCSTAKEFQDAYRKIDDRKTILELTEVPCNEMILLSIDSINADPRPIPEDISVMFYYTEKTYEEIQYTKMMGFESWLSNVGGFVGIFLGYSMMQIPEFLNYIISFIQTQKKKSVTSKLVSKYPKHYSFSVLS